MAAQDNSQWGKAGFATSCLPIAPQRPSAQLLTVQTVAASGLMYQSHVRRGLWAPPRAGAREGFGGAIGDTRLDPLCTRK
ncbi:MAG: hypothetical protein AMXMBFR13_19550 [Phycisphaerae bacterium]